LSWALLLATPNAKGSSLWLLAVLEAEHEVEASLWRLHNASDCPSRCWLAATTLVVAAPAASSG